MIQYLLKSADFSGLFKFISPSFFKVVSPKVVFQIASEIRRNQSDVKCWERIQTQLSQNLEKAGLDVSLGASADRVQGSKGSSPVSLTAQELGHKTLELFFFQILTQDVWVVDLRTAAFEGTQGSVLWRPKSYYFKLSPEFLEGVRSLYRGFYTGDDALFDRALKMLKMDPARDSFKKHFGLGDQTSVAFKLKVFQDTFTEVFDACAKAKNTLPGDFFVLGVMLVALYERLETLDVMFNVRSCFDSVMQRKEVP